MLKICKLNGQFKKIKTQFLFHNRQNLTKIFFNFIKTTFYVIEKQKSGTSSSSHFNKATHLQQRSLHAAKIK